MSKSDIISGNLADFFKGLVGGGLTIASAITAHQEHIEYALRCAVNLTGICVGLVTIWSIVRRSNRGL